MKSNSDNSTVEPQQSDVIRCVSGATVGKSGQWVMSGRSVLGVRTQPLFTERLQSSGSCHSFSRCHPPAQRDLSHTHTPFRWPDPKKKEPKTKLSACISEYNELPSAGLFFSNPTTAIYSLNVVVNTWGRLWAACFFFTWSHCYSTGLHSPLYWLLNNFSAFNVLDFLLSCAPNKGSWCEARQSADKIWIQC